MPDYLVSGLEPAASISVRVRPQIAAVAESSGLAVYDAVDGGAARVRTNVKVKGTPDAPVWRRVMLYDYDTHRFLRAQFSDAATGDCVFDYQRADRRYLAVSYDHTGIYAPVCDGPLTPEPM